MQSAPSTLKPALMTLARIKYLMGEQLVRVGPVAPDLATSLASVAVAQTNFGQARYFYNWHRGESRAADDEFAPDVHWEKEVQLLRFEAWPTWPHLIVVLWLVDEALATLVDEWATKDAAVSLALAKLREEVAQTLVFTREWVQIFVRQGHGLAQVVEMVQSTLGPALCDLLAEFGSTSGAYFTQRYHALTGGDGE